MSQAAKGLSGLSAVLEAIGAWQSGMAVASVGLGLNPGPAEYWV